MASSAEPRIFYAVRWRQRVAALVLAFMALMFSSCRRFRMAGWNDRIGSVRSWRCCLCIQPIVLHAGRTVVGGS